MNPSPPVVGRGEYAARREPRALPPRHRWLSRLPPVPGWCRLNLLTFREP